MEEKEELMELEEEVVLVEILIPMVVRDKMMRVMEGKVETEVMGVKVDMELVEQVEAHLEL